MGWIVFFIISVVIFLIFVPKRQWLRLWPMGLLTILILYLIDSTFIEFGAYSYNNQILSFSGISIFYLLSSIPGSILLVYFYPKNKKMQVPYILLSAFIFLLMELIMMWAGYFQYVHWNALKSFLLNIFGFTVVIWFAEWSGRAGKGK